MNLGLSLAVRVGEPSACDFGQLFWMPGDLEPPDQSWGLDLELVEFLDSSKPFGTRATLRTPEDHLRLFQKDWKDQSL